MYNYNYIYIIIYIYICIYIYIYIYIYIFIYIYIISYFTISVCMHEFVKSPYTHEFTSGCMRA